MTNNAKHYVFGFQINLAIMETQELKTTWDTLSGKMEELSRRAGRARGKARDYQKKEFEHLADELTGMYTSWSVIADEADDIEERFKEVSTGEREKSHEDQENVDNAGG